MFIVKNEEVIVTLAVAMLVEKPLSHRDHGITYIILTILVGENTFIFHFGLQSGCPYGRIFINPNKLFLAQFQLRSSRCRKRSSEELSHIAVFDMEKYCQYEVILGANKLQ